MSLEGIQSACPAVAIHRPNVQVQTQNYSYFHLNAKYYLRQG